MRPQEINLDIIKTKPYRASFLSRNYVSFENFGGFIKKKNEIVLFSEQFIDNFNHLESIRVYHISKETVDVIKHNYKVSNSYNYKSIITEIDKEYFQINGRINKEKRNVMNKYLVNLPLTEQEFPNSIEEVQLFLKNWKEKRKEKYNEKMMFTGYDLNFVRNYLEKFKPNIISKFYYYKNKLVGFTIIEKVNDNFLNLLIRKADPDFSQLTYFIDFSSFKEIFENSGSNSIIVNLGVDSGDKGIHNYKVKKFPLMMEIKTCNIKIDFKTNINNIRR